jgi:hypothetical protein
MISLDLHVSFWSGRFPLGFPARVLQAYILVWPIQAILPGQNNTGRFTTVTVLTSTDILII